MSLPPQLTYFEQSISERGNYHHDLLLDVDVLTHVMLKSMNQK